MLSQQRNLLLAIATALLIYVKSYLAIQEIEIFKESKSDAHPKTEAPPASEVPLGRPPRPIEVTPSESSVTDVPNAQNTPSTPNKPNIHTTSDTLNETENDLSPNGAFNGLLDLCKQTNWTEGLWVHCHSNCGEKKLSVCGGLNNARNRIQTCLRLAIDTGAGIIIPSATARNEENLVQTDDKTVCPNVFWDMEYLGEAMAEQCPQLKIRVCDDRSGIETVIEPEFRTYMQAAHSNTTFRELVRHTMEMDNMTFDDVTAATPAVVSFGDAYIGFNYMVAVELSTIRKALFKVLKFNQDLLDLSAQVLKSKELHQGAFIGVHLRGENDWPGGFGDVGSQMRAYTAEIQSIDASVSYDIKTVYASCGDASVIQTFRETLEPLGYTVHDKWTLLAGQNETLRKVESLMFDEKGIVEYQVMMEARFWMGVITSSFSSLIAYARTVDDPDDFFETYIFPNSSKSGLNRNYPEPMTVKGNSYTKLMVVNGVDIMEAFP
ncbi:hypothetical protein LSUE1_G002011 [Lachnellula suecica]|uniref:Alternative oxidase n=1 Tax=Lachnellula suecica TaxID=602035 RepID=A0A8T9CBJ2_9HELO|nr:hypothetical protein LSUE1_G002011 [Lachnellula suecica]